jgi:hypothetical protein
MLSKRPPRKILIGIGVAATALAVSVLTVPAAFADDAGVPQVPLTDNEGSAAVGVVAFANGATCTGTSIRFGGREDIVVTTQECVDRDRANVLRARFIPAFQHNNRNDVTAASNAPFGMFPVVDVQVSRFDVTYLRVGANERNNSLGEEVGGLVPTFDDREALASTQLTALGFDRDGDRLHQVAGATQNGTTAPEAAGLLDTSAPTIAVGPLWGSDEAIGGPVVVDYAHSRSEIVGVLTSQERGLIGEHLWESSTFAMLSSTRSALDTLVSRA